MLAYDYRTLDEDFAEAETYLTDEFAAKRNALFDQKAESGLTLREQVVEDKVVVDGRGVADRAHPGVAEGDRATVVVYVDQDSQKGKEAPRVAADVGDAEHGRRRRRLAPRRHLHRNRLRLRSYGRIGPPRRTERLT